MHNKNVQFGIMLLQNNNILSFLHIFINTNNYRRYLYICTETYWVLLILIIVAF